MSKPAIDYRPLTRLRLQGYKSIRDCDLELRPLNLLIGANGAGKSNLLSFFKLMQQMMAGQLQLHVSLRGGPDALLHYGRKQTQQLSATLYFGDDYYQFALRPNVANQMIIAEESVQCCDAKWQLDISGRFETAIREASLFDMDKFMYASAMHSWHVYHLNDSSDAALVKQRGNIGDNVFLRGDCSNLAAYLYVLQTRRPHTYRQIERTIQLVAPFFGGFHLRPCSDNVDQIELEWTETGHDQPFKAHHLSDGTLRFVCLAALLTLDDTSPATILIDEPELGLHPYAIGLLAAMLRSASSQRQVIVSTQSLELLNEMQADDIIVVDRKAGESLFKRCSSRDLSDWLDDYSLGDLWKMNILGGRPSR